MRIDNLVRITQGELYQTPSIAQIDGVSFDPDRVKSGDLYICKNNSQESLKKAISNGAYALLSEKTFDVTDKEIAWIKVEDLELALIKLARYFIATNKIDSYLINPKEKLIFDALSKPKGLSFIENSLDKLIESFFNSKKTLAIFSENEDTLKQIAPNYKALPTCNEEVFISSKSLFYSTFLFNGKAFNALPISPFFIPSFVKVLFFLQNFEWSFSNIKPLTHFRAIFITKKFRMLPFGMGEKALIVEENLELFKEEILYLKSRICQKDLLIAAPKSLNLGVDFEYDTLEEILNLDTRFKYILLFANYEDLLSLFEKKDSNKELTLF